MMQSRLFFLFGLFLFFVPSASPSLASDEGSGSPASIFSPDQELRAAFRKLMAKATKDPVDRLMKAIDLGPAGKEEVHQILESHRLQSLETFFLELKGRIDLKRQGLSRAQEELLRVQSSKMLSEFERNQRVSQLLMEITSQGRETRSEKLSPSQLASLIHFYKEFDPVNSRLIQPKPFLYKNTTKARLAAEVTAWPVIEIREHGYDLPRVSYGTRESSVWRSTAEAFWNRDLQLEFIQIWSQLVNQTAGHMRYRHLETFEHRFLLKLREWALKNDPFQARDLFVAYLSNYSSSQMIAKFGVDPKAWPKNSKESLAYKIILLKEIKNRKELIDFFTSATLPKRFSESDSIIWNQARRVFSTANQIPDREKCLEALLRSTSSQTETKKSSDQSSTD